MRLKKLVLAVVLLAVVAAAGYLPQIISGNTGTELVDESGNVSVLTAALSDGAAISVDTEAGESLSNEELVRKVGPAVVSIVTESLSQGWFLQPTPQTGAGSGAIISPDGYILTNNHVVEGASKITVTLSDGRVFQASSAVTDAETDLAVVKIDAKGLPYLHMLHTSLQQVSVLEEVVAVGNALALEGGPTWTKGVVSNLGRSIDFGNGIILYDLIQTDAAINPGNSGGPLVNMAGQLVGINVAIAAEAENIGFAISTDTAVQVVQSLIDNGSVSRPWLGVSMVTVNSTIARQYRLAVDIGVLVVQVWDGSPAAQAGLEAGDVVVGFDSQEVATSEELRQAIRARQAGDEVTVEFYRYSERRSGAVVLAQS